jgi:hypothetical protein
VDSAAPRRKTEALVFYHGTSAEAARAIVSRGANDRFFEDIGAFRLAKEIWCALLKVAHLSEVEAWRLPAAFASYDSLSPWASALQQLISPAESSQIEYGSFFATLNISVAYRYVIRNPYRSEFVQVLAETLDILRRSGSSLPNAVERRFPEVDRLIRSPSPPVVLELRGVSPERLRTERGNSDIEGELQSYEDMLEFEGLSAPAAFRIQGVRPADVAAVHDLSDWSAQEIGDSMWMPDQERVSASRTSVPDWLATKNDVVIR